MTVQLKNTYPLQPCFYTLDTINLEQHFDYIEQENLKDLANKTLNYKSGNECDYILACVKDSAGNVTPWDAVSFSAYDQHHLGKETVTEPATRRKMEEVAYYIFDRSGQNFRQVASEKWEFLSSLIQVNTLRDVSKLTKEERAKRQFEIAKTYAEGENIVKDVWMAKRYFQRSIDNGSDEALTHVQHLYSKAIKNRSLSSREKHDLLVQASALRVSQGKVALCKVLEYYEDSKHLTNSTAIEKAREFRLELPEEYRELPASVLVKKFAEECRVSKSG